MFDFANYLTLHNGQAHTVLGCDACALSHSDYLFLDFVLFHHPHINRVVELGTQYGLTALYLGMSMRLRGGDVLTFDIRDMRVPNVKEAWLPNVEFFNEDILALNQRAIDNLTENTLLFCDNGEKEEEVAQYSPYMKSGSVILIHDWSTEVNPDRIVNILSRWHPFRHDVAEAMGCHLRAFER